MMNLRKFQIGPTNGKCPLIQINLNKLRRFYFLVKLRVIHPSAIFNNMPAVCSSCEKHLGIYLDEKLSFSNHINEKISRANKGIGILRKLYNDLLRNSLITIYKSFIRHHLDYGAIIFDKPENESFCKKLNLFNIILH